MIRGLQEHLLGRQPQQQTPSSTDVDVKNNEVLGQAAARLPRPKWGQTQGGSAPRTRRAGSMEAAIDVGPHALTDYHIGGWESGGLRLPPAWPHTPQSCGPPWCPDTCNEMHPNAQSCSLWNPLLVSCWLHRYDGDWLAPWVTVMSP